MENQSDHNQSDQDTTIIDSQQQEGNPTTTDDGGPYDHVPSCKLAFNRMIQAKALNKEFKEKKLSEAQFQKKQMSWIDLKRHIEANHPTKTVVLKDENGVARLD